MRQLRTEISAGTIRADVACDALISKVESGDVAAFTAMRDTIGEKPGTESAVQVGIAIAVEYIGNE